MLSCDVFETARLVRISGADRLQPFLICTFQLIRQIADDLRQRSTIAGCQRPLDPTGAPNNRSNERNQWQPGDDKTYVPRRIVIHTDLHAMASRRRTLIKAMMHSLRSRWDGNDNLHHEHRPAGMLKLGKIRRRPSGHHCLHNVIASEAIQSSAHPPWVASLRSQ
uniref:hypothetical protein n=1 Tax=Bradyrhizobium sp. (strain ORS 278) TaxID=114615 RepID=UPI0012FF39C4|nr:hypothetical protein [Bradyrhizobium sp. ORS 278]